MFKNLTKKELKELKKYIKNYENKFRETIDIDEEIKFGCEVEFNSDKSTNHYGDMVSKEYEVKRDASGATIIEVVSPIMHNTVDDWASFLEMLNSLEGARIESNTGGHIHYDASIINESDLVSFLKLWYVFEDIIFEFSAGEFERLRSYALIYARKITELKTDIDLVENGERDVNSFRKYDKKTCLNLSNHFSKDDIYCKNIDTYEVRVPNASVNVTTWQNNVEFFAKFFVFSGKPENKVLIDNLYKQGKLKVNMFNEIILADLLYDTEEAKIRFLNQFVLDKQFDNESKKKSILSIFGR